LFIILRGEVSTILRLFTKKTIRTTNTQAMSENRNALLRELPKVDECILELAGRNVVVAPPAIIKKTVQALIEEQRKLIINSHGNVESKTREQWFELFADGIEHSMKNNLRRVLNCSGVVIHTNLGRSILAKSTTDMLVQTGGYYSNLEFNLETGKRGSRYSLVEEIICDLTGAEAALVVNNNAAAVLICLDTLAQGKEVIVSRGQLVEIGGSFRIPDVMAKSGASLVEVGATNRTHLHDYEDAITDDTQMLLRVHTSNFRIIGFTSEVSAEEMVELATSKKLITMEDLGSGSLVDFSKYGFPKEPTVQEIVKAGVDVVTFSGDKLLGGPQAGIIVGKKETIEKIKKNPLNRALRIDKFTLAALESVLREYYDVELALKNVPTLNMLTTGDGVVKKRAQRLIRRIKTKISENCTVKLTPTVSRVGGGALPEHNIKSWAVELAPQKIKISELERRFRQLDNPIIGRVENERLLLDLRTVQDIEISLLGDLIAQFFTGDDTRA
jgi:L-seryl-tRNA(Ser) seleniumtransferase